MKNSDTVLYFNYVQSFKFTDHTPIHYDLNKPITDKNHYHIDIIRMISTIRNRAKFDGHIVMFFFGGILPNSIRLCLTEHNVEIISLVEKYNLNYLQNGQTLYYIMNQVINSKFIEIIDYLKDKQYKYVIYSDIDCWYQKMISEEEMGAIDGWYVSGGLSGGFRFDDKIFPEKSAQFNEKLSIIKELDFAPYSNGICGGWIAGNVDAFKEKSQLFKNMMTYGHLVNLYGTDEMFLLDAFNQEKDRINSQYNYIVIDNEYEDKNTFEVLIDNKTYYNDRELFGFHKAYKLFQSINKQHKLEEV